MKYFEFEFFSEIFNDFYFWCAEFFDVSHLSVAFVVRGVKVGDGQTVRQSLYKSFHSLRYKRSMEAKRPNEEGTRWISNYLFIIHCKKKPVAFTENFRTVDSLNQYHGIYSFKPYYRETSSRWRHITGVTHNVIGYCEMG